MYEEDNLPADYLAWMKQVDAILVKHVGMESGGMGDFPSRDLFDDEATPAEAAAECLRWNDAPFELIEAIEAAA